jgi:hypothetical protein
MAEQLTWLQAQVTKADWEGINQRRLKLNLKWSNLLLPATLAYLDQLEAGQPDKTTKHSPATPKSKKTVKKTRAEVKAEDEGGKHGDADGAGQTK